MCHCQFRLWERDAIRRQTANGTIRATEDTSCAKRATLVSNERAVRGGTLWAACRESDGRGKGRSNREYTGEKAI
ncbi:hypothetical protein XELAEV_18009876mg [Xenopus laevis]|uniref:Uncharacterized protein n=1 Tax=Xenopus laevis TaxID=8355 RepID=A0A974DUU2_XENLA|nr:hypothetical protein XELAEV_18009876mg [Xenopus laevis]